MTAIKSVAPFGEVGNFAVAPTLLTGTDSLTYKPSSRQTLYIHNDSASPVNIVIDGDAGTTVDLPGQGASTSVAGGFTVAVAAGAIQAVALANIRNYLQGNVAVTGGGAGVYAWIQEG